MIGDIWYRYMETQYAAPLDEYERPMGNGSVQINLTEYHVIKETPKGVWLRHTGFLMYNWKKFVLLGSRKKFACPTKEEAMVSFIARKRAQIRIYKDRLESAEMALAIVEGDKL